MRQKRLRAPESWSLAYYHCISRVVGREFLLGEVEKAYFVKLMRQQERFCLVRVVSYCVLDNHFHLLVEEGSQCFEAMDDVEFLGHIRSTRSKEEYGQVAQDLERWSEQGQRKPIEELKASYFRRMGNVSFFMKGLKQEFTQWYNRRHGRQGTLWESRFKSVLINGMDAQALAMVSAYIDLNPVRAGMVEDPRDYRWSGYGAACAGQSLARQGIKQVVDTLHGYGNRQPVGAGRAVEIYRTEMLVQGGQQAINNQPRPSHQQPKDKLPVADALRVRVRYFTDGAVIGSRQSIDEVFKGQRWRFGPRRSSGARSIRGIDCPGLCALRDLRVDVFG